MFLAGCSGGINGLAAVLGKPLCKMHELAVMGHWEEALKLQRKLVNIDLLVIFFFLYVVPCKLIQRNQKYLLYFQSIVNLRAMFFFSSFRFTYRRKI